MPWAHSWDFQLHRGGGAIPWMGKKDVVRCIPFGFGTGKFFFFSFFLLDMMTEELLCNLLHVGTMRLRLFAQEYSCDSWCDLWFTSGAQMMSLVEGMKFSLHAINLLRKLKLQEQWES